LVGGEKGEVVAYDENGKLRWQGKVSSEVSGTPEVSEGIVVVRSGDGRIAGLNAADGKRLWLYEHITPALAVRSNAGVTIRHGTIFAGFAGGKLVAISLASGNLKWEATLSEPRGNTELERISDITSPPQVDDATVCAVSFQGRIGCFGASQGNLLWSREFSSDKGMEIVGQYIYVTDAQGNMFALDKSSGSSVWKNEQLSAQRTAAPHTVGDYLVAGDHLGKLYAMKREDGNLAARLETDGSAILGPPVEMDGGLLVQTYDGGLYSVVLH
jgi:outer membrane protein assembly factor BamB